MTELVDMPSAESGGEASPRRARWQLAAAFIAGAAISAVVLVVPASTSDREGALVADARSTTALPLSTAAVAPSTSAPPKPATATAAPTGPPGRGAVATDPTELWTLNKRGSCLELVLAEARFPGLLCDAQPAAGVIGDLVALDTPRGRVVVAVVDPSITGFSSYPRPGGGGGGGIFHQAATGRDPARDEVAYIAGFVAAGWMDLLLRSGAQTPARVLVPRDDRTYTAPELQTVTAPSFGLWPSYRHAETTGFFFGGEQLLGFYDGAAGETCVLYRRLGGIYESVLVDACMTGAFEVPVARLIPIDASQFPDTFIVLAATKFHDGELWIDAPGYEPIGPAGSPFGDPAGSGWTAFAQSIDFVEIPPGPREVEFVFRAFDGSVRARATVAMPGR